MRVDCRLYVRDLALAAILFAAVGLNSAAYAENQNGLENMKNPKFALDPSWPKPLPATTTNGVAHRWVQGEVAGNCVDLHDNVYTFNRGWEVGVTYPRPVAFFRVINLAQLLARMPVLQRYLLHLLLCSIAMATRLRDLETQRSFKGRTLTSVIRRIYPMVHTAASSITKAICGWVGMATAWCKNITRRRLPKQVRTPNGSRRLAPTDSVMDRRIQEVLRTHPAATPIRSIPVTRC